MKCNNTVPVGPLPLSASEPVAMLYGRSATAPLLRCCFSVKFRMFNFFMFRHLIELSNVFCRATTFKKAFKPL